MIAGISWTALFGLSFGLSDFVLSLRKNTDLQMKLELEVLKSELSCSNLTSKYNAQEFRFISVLFESQEYLTSLRT